MERKIFWFLDKVVKYGNSHDIGDAGCDATPEEIKLVKNIIKQIKTNEKTKEFSWNYDN